MAWTKPRSSQDIPYVSKDVVEREVKGNLDYLKDAVDDNVTDIATNVALFDDVSQTVPTRVKDTIYQNTSGKIRLISIVAYSAASSDEALLEVAATTPPTVVVAAISSLSAAEVESMFAVIPPDYYYRLRETTATITISKWTEWDLF